ncbi:beta-ketoacyl synthase chain length factor [Pasteurella atlantica]|uniref:Beta-ketoacyl synthase chain length factor n=2 Tax=Pasteurellaceae TaxID=712 RepID=A0ACC6HK18_9PAST|nr:beta-ketoacyl synthase chain length factor [Pasteurella atlantica]MDP8033762.1 beta-ketoacyl synthase chain length factor [Pasteurella atlantica]MDP8035697.1 beta-ketoacyl synthase chain length factor [Pasteurella atlantica]MDP8037622.1 beta-ketoacyl synthase chain length factor [Pasteurella atlantica]MDP8047997.1 beta-ketoacyl synthase chain length factor [Pasteurella atlantica]MDP8049952.1 beta-ketoacyl synthase chain length factor [Pasteurella atlantica]
MKTMICDFSINICNWRMVSNKILSPEDWQLGEYHWIKHSDNWDDFQPKLAFLPPLKRRRLSPATRLFFEAAWDLVAEDPNIPVVYASLNSEINRSFALWQELLKEGDISPTSFSLSVHNALIGQWSELRKVTQEMTALCALKDNLETAIMEAYLMLNEGAEKVLVAVCEFPLDEQYNVQPISRLPFGYALALVIEKGDQYHLSLHNQSTENDNLDNALSFVKNKQLNSTSWQTPSSSGGYWRWHKN